MIYTSVETQDEIIQPNSSSLKEDTRPFRKKMLEKLAFEEVTIIHKMEKLNLDRIDNEKKLKSTCKYFRANNCTQHPNLNLECQIFSLICIKYGITHLESDEK